MRTRALRSRRLHSLAGVLATGWLAACTTLAPTPSPPGAGSGLPPQYEATEWSALPGWTDDDVGAAWPAFRVGCRALLKAPATEPLWRRVCEQGAATDSADTLAVRTFFETHFSPYSIRSSDGNDSGLVTGYYEPLLAGSRVKTPRYAIPLYAEPGDLLTVDLASLHPDLKGRRLRGRLDGQRVLPYWSRAEIGAGRAMTGGNEIAWVETPIDAFFAEIQGSTRIALAEGGTLRLGYANQNGHPYRAIGRVLVERGELTVEEASMQGIRAWAERHPERLPALLNENPSYVFFREVAPPPPGSLDAAIDGPPGSLGVPLLRERVIAADPRAIPPGAPVFIATTEPVSMQPLRRLVLTQDTGGAIRGAVRADFFWGTGDAAGRLAGRMRQPGRLWLLWPKGVPLPKS